jgi:hypothetical protein
MSVTPGNFNDSSAARSRSVQFFLRHIPKLMSKADKTLDRRFAANFGSGQPVLEAAIGRARCPAIIGYTEVEYVCTSGRFDLSIITADCSGWSRGSVTYHFQLKQAPTEERYNDLWWRVDRGNGLRIETK